ncbi:transmembrane protein 106B-like [Branchiostoma floridae]|uniref:Transmembrane protein 106B-like n=1 Tax=Branchiostoma floridae TaxID=7739 RepID=A0A9J7N1P2_BRAFL|nr:transmembrane protein 106B-like [Branchiostoma floridae]
MTRKASVDFRGPRKKSYGTMSVNGLSGEHGEPTDGEVMAAAASDSWFEDLIGSRHVRCPTCNGSGKIPKGQEDKLVALIPYSDNRLKPRRTKLYVFIAVFITLLACGLLIFFLMPREVQVSNNHIKKIDVHVNKTQGTVWIYMESEVNVTNWNFFPVTMGSMSLQVLYHETVVGKSLTTATDMVPIRAHKQVKVSVNTTFDDSKDLGYVAELCSNPIDWVHHLFLQLQITCSTSYLSHSENLTLTDYEYVDCGVVIPPVTIPPVTLGQPQLS